MKEQLLLLKELQKIDLKVQEVRQAITALPEKLVPAKSDLAKLEALLQHERNHVAETEAWRKEQEELITREEEAVKAAKSKLQASKNARDYAAASRELEHKRKSISEREDEVLKVVEAMEQTRKALEAREKDVGELRDRVNAEEAQINVTIAELEKQASEAANGRDEIIAKLPAELMGRYEAVLKRRGVAMVPVVSGICQGCHMSLPPQLNNQLARFESLENCPTCQRLIYRAELLAEAEARDDGASS